jgi:hypothetical protein
MMIPIVLTQPVKEEESLLTPMGILGPKIRTTGMIMVDKEAPDLKVILLNSLKVIEAKLWTSWLLSKGSWLWTKTLPLPETPIRSVPTSWDASEDRKLEGGSKETTTGWIR